MQGHSLRFDDASRASLSDQPLATGTAPQAIRQAAMSCGLDPSAELYNEALQFANEGHLKRARERVQVLLALAPEDTEARLLLAKIAVAGQRWKEALAALDEAQSHGQPVPNDLRRAVEEHLRAEQASEDQQRMARSAAQQGEVKALRQEARRLRSENAQLLGRVTELDVENRRWTMITAGVSGMAILLMLASLVLGGGSDAPVASEFDEPTGPGVTAEAPPVTASAPLTAAPATMATTPPSPVSLTERAADVLSTATGLDGTDLEVSVGGGEAMLSGTVQNFAQLKRAEQVLLGIPGISAVQTSPVLVKARTDGAVHTVVSGDNLSRIAYRYYGDSSATKGILDANKAVLKGKPNLQIGMMLRIPPKD